MGLDPVRGNTLWTLNWESKSTIPDQAGQYSQSTRNTKENSVVVVFHESVVLKEDTAVGINIWPWVLGLSVLSEDFWDNMVQLADKLEEWVVWQVLQGKLTLAHVAWVSLSEDSVSESWNNLSRVQSIPNSLLDDFNVSGVSELLLQFNSPAEDFLVGKSVEWTSKTSHTSSEGEVWVRESRADKVGGVGTDITSLVIAVNNQVQAHKLVELWVVESKHSGEVDGPVVGVGAGELSVLVDVTVDSGSEFWELGNEVQGVFVDVFPVFLLVDTLEVGRSKLAVLLQSENTNAELGHWVECLWERVQSLDGVLWELRAGVEFLGNSLNLSLGWYLTSDEEPQETLWEWFFSSLGLWKKLLDLWDGVASEADTFLSVQKGGFGDQALHASSTSISLVDSAGTQNLLSVVFLDLLDLLSLLWDELSQSVLQSRFVSGGNVASGWSKAEAQSTSDGGDSDGVDQHLGTGVVL